MELNKDRIRIISLTDSPKTLVLSIVSHQDHREIREQSPRGTALNETMYELAIFEFLSRRITETEQLHSAK